jgi:adenylyltransferase/sulfurtransferase
MRVLGEGNTAGLEGTKTILEPWASSARVVASEPDPDCPVCVHGEFAVLAGALADRTAVLCGRTAVQVLPAAGDAGRVDLERLACRLEPLGRVEWRERLLRFDPGEGFTVTLFEDGRAIFHGLTDPVRARSLYGRFVGE